MRSMRFESSVVVETLQGLEKQLVAHRGHLAQVAAALAAGQFAAAFEAASQLRDSLGAVDAMYKRLYANVVPVDNLGSVVESVGELALRGRRMVILTQLAVLRKLLEQSDGMSRAHGWFVGKFHCIDDVEGYFDGEFRKINRLWTQYRQNQAEVVGMSASDRTTLYRASVRVAQRALHALRNHSDLAYLLRAGLGVIDWPEALAAFTQIVVVLGLQLDVEANRVPLAEPTQLCTSERIATSGS
jgi:hypothetical protein